MFSHFETIYIKTPIYPRAPIYRVPRLTGLNSFPKRPGKLGFYCTWQTQLHFTADQNCGIQEVNGFLKAVCYQFDGGFTIYQCPHSQDRYYYSKKFSYEDYQTFNATCPNDPAGYQVLLVLHLNDNLTDFLSYR